LKYFIPRFRNISPRAWLYFSNLINLDAFALAFQSLKTKPNLLYFNLLPLFLVKYGKRGFRFYTLMKTLRLSSFPKKRLDNPAIELLILACQKDLNMITFVVEKAIENSLNPIKKVNIVCPQNILEQVKTELYLIKSRYKNVIVDYKSDYEILGDELYQKILADFPNRFGWIAQQFLTVKSVLDSRSVAVLQVDADTINLRPMTWLEKSGRQAILCSTEYHAPYYIVIKRLLGLRKLPLESHICHQMLFQPELFKRYLEYLGILTVSQLYDQYMQISSDLSLEESRFCAKYELYAYLMKRFSPNSIIKVKFCNSAISRKIFLESPEIILRNFSRNYSSVSAHSYLDNL
jgi:hypothetical protein